MFDHSLNAVRRNDSSKYLPTECVINESLFNNFQNCFETIQSVKLRMQKIHSFIFKKNLYGLTP